MNESATAKAPNQDRNAGNRGDVWKHRVLLAIASRLLQRRDGVMPFRYFESHAGKGVYDLTHSAGDRPGVRTALERLPPSDPYVEAESESVAADRYLGSWKLMANLLERSGATGCFRLCDTDPSVLDRARPNASGPHEFDFHAGDGFAAASAFDANLYFIDPFASWTESARVAISLADKNLLIWYGIVAPGKPNELVQATGLFGLEVFWSRLHENLSPTQRGCGLLLSAPLLTIAADAMGELFLTARRLGWQMHLRVPWESHL